MELQDSILNITGSENEIDLKSDIVEIDVTARFRLHLNSIEKFEDQLQALIDQYKYVNNAKGSYCICCRKNS